jgi:hypothetical protein
MQIIRAERGEHTSVTHSPAWRSRDTSDEAHNRLASVILLQPLRRILFCATTNLTNHDNAISLCILDKHIQTIDKVRAAEWITTNTDDQALTESRLCCLVYSFICKRA